MRTVKRRHIVAAVAALLAGTSATPAFAEWETITGSPREENNTCNAEHTRLPGRISNNGQPIGISAGYHGQIEIYGHFIEVSPSASISGTGGSGIEQPKITDRRGGAENGPRRCGAIGSVVVEIDIPENATAGPALLTVGGERIPLYIYRPHARAMLWAEQSLAGGSVSGRSTSSPSSTLGRSPPPPPVTVTGSTAGCNANGVGCSNESGLVIVGGQNGGSSGGGRTLTLPPAIGGCIAELGGALEIDDRTMTITLPTNRQAGGVQECLSRPIYFNFELTNSQTNSLSGYGRMNSASIPVAGDAMQRRTYDIPAFNGIAGFAGPQPVSGRRDFLTLYLPEDVREDFVGITNKQVRTSSVSLIPLTLTIRSNPSVGINTILAWPTGRTRIGAKLPMKFDFHAAPTAPVTTKWRVRSASGANPSDCFADTAGTISTNRLITEFDLTLKPGGTCETQRFSLDVTVVDPASPANDPFFVPYMRTMSFIPGPATDIVRPTAPRTL